MRNPHTGLGTVSKSQGNRSGRNSEGVSLARAQGQAQGLEMTAKELAIVVIVDVYGQEVARLPVKPEKTVWQTSGVKPGIYFYKMEIEGEVLSGKIVVQK